MFGRSTITYAQPRQIIVSNFYSFWFLGSQYFLFPACGPRVKKVMFLKGLILLSVLFADGKKKET